MPLVQFPAQKRFECTFKDLQSWVSEFERLRMDAEMAKAFTGPPQPHFIATKAAETPPCIGCGQPTGGGADPALIVDQAAMKAIFRPCECELTISE